MKDDPTEIPPPPDFEFDAEELAARARAIVAIYGGPTWHVLETYEEIIAQIDGCIGDERITLRAHQEPPLDPAQIQINPNLIATVFEITEGRWKADRSARAAQEQQMRAAAARGGIVAPGAPPGPGLN